MASSHLPARSGQRLPALAIFATICAVTVAGPAYPDDLSATGTLADFSLEELLNTEIMTLSRKSENLGAAPAAVYVISQSDIRRSGARTIPDLLRMVPGMQVAQLDGNKWAVTARGANGRFANKLLVLMDGRTLYSPLLSGVYWDEQDTDLAAIERIEVIRGPGATMWGSNAVNGVVNIITKHAADTQGGNLSLAGGPAGVESAIRYGAEANGIAYRVFAKLLDRDGNVNLIGDDVGDDAEMQRIGGRLDWDGQDGQELTVSAEVYSGESGEHRISRSLIPPYETIVDAHSDVSGAFALATWSKDLTEDSSFAIRSYYSATDRETATYAEERRTFDFDIQHRVGMGNRHDLMWGISYRNSRDDTTDSFEIQLNPASRTQELFSAFVQDDISLLDDRARLIIGSKFEKNNFSVRDVEIEPGIRMSMALGQYSTVWASVSRAVRMPSRGEQDGRVVSAVLPPGQPDFPLPVPLVPVVYGNPDMQTEDVTAYEIGYRMRNDELLIDVAAFYNDFDDLRSLLADAPTCQPGGENLLVDPACLAAATHVEAPLTLANQTVSKTAGVELLVSQQMADWWRLQGGYTYFHVDEDDAGPKLGVVEDSPDHQLSLRSAMDLRQDLELDLWLRWVDELEAQQVDRYTALDLRVAWTPSPTISVAAVGRNLFADKHVEFMSELVDLAPVQIEAEAYIEIRWSF